MRATLRNRYAMPVESAGIAVQAFADVLLIADPPNPAAGVAGNLREQCAELMDKIAGGIEPNDSPTFALDDGFSLFGLAAEARDCEI